MFKERAVLNVWRSESNVLTELVIQLDRECLQLTKRTVKWNVQQGTNENMVLGLSLQVCGVIRIEMADLRHNVCGIKMIFKG